MKKIILIAALFCAVGFAQEEGDVQEVVQNGAIIEIDQENFESVLEDATLPVIIDVNASWCGPCQMFGPVFDEVSGEYGDSAQFAKMNFDSQGALAKKWGVSSLPTVLFFKPREKKPSMKSVGYMDKEEFVEKINRFLKS